MGSSVRAGCSLSSASFHIWMFWLMHRADCSASPLMHDFAVNGSAVFKCVSRDGMLYLMPPLQNILAAAAARKCARWRLCAEEFYFLSLQIWRTGVFFLGTEVLNCLEKRKRRKSFCFVEIIIKM